MAALCSDLLRQVSRTSTHTHKSHSRIHQQTRDPPFCHSSRGTWRGFPSIGTPVDTLDYTQKIGVRVQHERQNTIWGEHSTSQHPWSMRIQPNALDPILCTVHADVPTDQVHVTACPGKSFVCVLLCCASVLSLAHCWMHWRCRTQ